MRALCVGYTPPAQIPHSVWLSAYNTSFQTCIHGLWLPTNSPQESSRFPLSIPGTLPRIRALCVSYRPPDSPLSVPGTLPRIRALCVGYRPPDSPLSISGTLPRIRALCVGYTIHIPPPSGCPLQGPCPPAKPVHPLLKN